MRSKKLKQAIIVRKDLKLPKGKLAVQVAHASVEAVLKTLKNDEKLIKQWLKHAKKVVLKVENLEELKRIYNKARRKKLTTALIKDAGLTVVKPGTITALAIGPDDEEKIDEITKDLKLL